MAFDTFMYIEGGTPKVEGETQDEVYKDKKAFEVYSFSWGASNPVTVGSATGGIGAGKVSISSFNVMKKTDGSSPSLFINCCQGTHFTKATVVMRKAAGKKPLEFLKYEFTKVFVESIQWSGSTGGDDTPTESVSFAFAKVDTKYIPQNPDGSAGTMKPASWDLTANVSK